MGLAWLNKIAVTIEKKQSSLFTYPVEKQEKYIKHFPEPKDEFERSYFQYCCQMKLYGWPLRWLMNLAALPMSAILLNKYKRNTVKPAQKADCIFIREQLSENLAPKSLREKYPEIVSVVGNENSLSHDDVEFLKSLFKRYPFSWMLWLKTIIKMSQYSAVISQFSPNAIISCGEFSFASSAVTKYCRIKDVKCINVMHGEKLYFMRDSFVCFDEYYVWNEHYKKLLIELGAEPSQFRIEIPNSLKIPNNGVDKEFDFTYYLGAENRQILSKIADCLREIKEKGNKIAIRPHPRYSDMEAVEELFYGFSIEDIKMVPIDESILRTKNAVSLYSTVLNQAINSGVGIVIDDVSSPKNYKKLKELRYTVLKEEHKVLSSFLEDK